MRESLIEIALDEGRWLVIAMALGLVVSLVCGRRAHWRRRPGRERWSAMLSAFYGTVIGTMGSAHLLAVSIVAARGELSASPWLVYPLGIALAVPAWWLVACAFSAAAGAGRRALILNACLGAILLALGPTVNWPLALPAVLNFAYARHRRPALGVTLLALSLIFYGGLLVGGLLFMASGQTFDEFMGEPAAHSETADCAACGSSARLAAAERR